MSASAIRLALVPASCLSLAISVTLWATSVACKDCTTNYSYLQAGVAYLWANKDGAELKGQGSVNEVKWAPFPGPRWLISVHRVQPEIEGSLHREGLKRITPKHLFD